MLSLCPMPYGLDSLEPHISARTLDFHHNKHHKTYVKETNELAGKDGLEDRSLEEIVAKARAAKNRKLFQNAAQAWNHALYWQSMSPEGGAPDGDLAKAIERAFGDLAGLREEFLTQGAEHFASGWLWLAAGTDGVVEVRQTHDAETLCDAGDLVPLLVCDLWEHAYYLDRQNLRKAYLEAWFDSLANWKFAGEQFGAAKDGERGYRYPQEHTEPA